MAYPTGKSSAVANGTSLFMGQVDERTAPARLFGELLRMAEEERGGREAMSVVQRQAARAWAVTTVEMERMAAEATAAGKPLPPEHGVLCDRADRQARRMGPVKAPARKTIRDHLAAKAKP